MPTLTGGQALAAALTAAGVDTVFGIPGVHTMGFYDALLDAPQLRHVLTRHEQGAAFMADGFARASGRIAAVCTITGPGITNAATALAEAYADSSPLLHIATGLDSHLPRHDRGQLHELRDQPGLLNAIVGYHRRVHSVREIGHAIVEAVHHMRASRPAPASIEIPLDFLTESADVDAPRMSPVPRLAPETSAVDRAAQVLVEAQAPVIYAGGGALDAAPELLAVAERLQAPVLTNPNGKGAFPESHALSLGCKARLDSSIYDFMKSCDVALIVGTRLGDRVTDDGRLPLPERLIQIDIDTTVIGRMYRVVVGIHARASDALAALLEALSDRPASLGATSAQAVAAFRRAQQAASPKPAYEAILHAVRATLPPTGVLANDMTMVSYQAPRYFPVEHPRCYQHPTYFGALGGALPQAIGAKVACPERAVVSLSGDGGFLFTSEELATAVRERLSVVAVVLNDNAFGAIDMHLRNTYGGRCLDVSLRNPDFAALARAYGAHGAHVKDPPALQREIAAALRRDGPTVIEYALS